MLWLGSVAVVFAQVLLLLTAVHVALAAWRRRDAQRLDILAFVGALLLVFWMNGPRSPFRVVAVALMAAQPFLLCRLVLHFSRIGLWLQAVLLLAVPIFVAGWLVWGRAWHDALTGYAAIVIGGFAVSIARESGRSSGVSQRRLVMAAVGCGLFALASGMAAASALGSVAVAAGAISPLLTSTALVCFFFTFSMPQRLAARWQRDEQAKYLTHIAAREPEARGALAADDLNAAAAAGVSNALTFVAMRPSGRPGVLVIRAATDAGLVGLILTAGDDLVAGVARSSAARSGPVAACQPDLAGRLAPYGARILVAPIVASDQTFGVVAAVQRRGSLFPDDDLALLEAFGRHAGTALDHARLVTDAKDRAQRSARRRLAEIEYRMALMLDSIKDYAIMILDEAGTVATWHAGAEHLFAYTPAEMTDEGAAPLFTLSPDALVALLGEARQLGLTRREGPCRRRDGATFLGATVIRPLETDEEGVQGFVVVTRDVTEQRGLEERLRQSQKMEAIGQLAGGIAHDFNNLLTAILGYSEWLAQDIEPSDRRRGHVDEIQKAAERAAGLTRQLLTFSRGQMLQPDVINLSRLVGDLLPMLGRMIGEHIEVVGQTASKVLPILADRTQIEQVVLNLALNARDAMPNGGRLTISTGNVWLSDIEARHDVAPGQYVLLSVEDTGVGMEAETLSHIFEPFFTTKEPGRGTGLGLATVYGIVKQMAGAVRVESDLGRGTAFRIYLPETQSRAEPVVPVVQVDLSGTETILLVEDDEAVRNYIRQVLERHGYAVVEAVDQVEALNAVHAHHGRVDLILSDVLMPRGTGPELVRALGEVLPGVPALFISGYADVALTRQVTFPKASHFLQKPFSADELLARIKHLLQSKR
jgi:PAS domain S-box-containing protein